MNLNEYLIESLNEIINSEPKLSKKGIEKLVRMQEKVKSSDRDLPKLRNIISGLYHILIHK